MCWYIHFIYDIQYNCHSASFSEHITYKIVQCILSSSSGWPLTHLRCQSCMSMPPFQELAMFLWWKLSWFGMWCSWSQELSGACGGIIEPIDYNRRNGFSPLPTNLSLKCLKDTSSRALKWGRFCGDKNGTYHQCPDESDKLRRSRKHISASHGITVLNGIIECMHIISYPRRYIR